jgi:branched-chain amino acid transport system substrate-binding protein
VLDLTTEAGLALCSTSSTAPKDIPLYSVYTVDPSTLKAEREAALGNYDAGLWGAYLDIPRSKQFVAAFK